MTSLVNFNDYIDTFKYEKNMMSSIPIHYIGILKKASIKATVKGSLLAKI